MKANISEVVGELSFKRKWTIVRYRNDEDFRRGVFYDTSLFEENILLNAGITTLWNLICGTGTPTAFNNANARLGVGDSTTAAAATQTGLVAATNKAYASMDASYPSVNAQTATWQATFGSAAANFAWNEFIVDNGATAAVAMNRKVSTQGTKASGQTWTLQLAITLS